MCNAMRYFCLLLVPALLSACTPGGSARDLLGLERQAPDEFQVVSRPPLSVPKEFYLRPPSDSEAEDIGNDTNQKARSLVTNTEFTAAPSLEMPDLGQVDTAAPLVLSHELESPGESAFLNQVGTNQADKTVRAKLSQDNAIISQQEPDLLDRLQGETNEEPVVDAKGEASRLRANKDAQIPLNKGDVKSIDPKKKSVIDRLFN